MHDFSRARNMLMSVANNILILWSFKQASCTIGMGEDLSDKWNTFHINGPANLFPRIHGFDFVSIHRKMHCPLIRFCFLLLASWPHVPCCSFCFFYLLLKWNGHIQTICGGVLFVTKKALSFKFLSPSEEGAAAATTAKWLEEAFFLTIQWSKSK